MSDLSPLSGEERKSNFGAARSVDGCSPRAPSTPTLPKPQRTLTWIKVRSAFFAKKHTMVALRNGR